MPNYTATSVDSASKFIFEERNIADLAATKQFNIGNYSSYNFISVQIFWKGLTGTAGTAKLTQSNDEKAPYVDIPSLEGDITGSDGSILLETSEFGGKLIGLSITKGTITGGTISAKIIAKSK